MINKFESPPVVAMVIKTQVVVTVLISMGMMFVMGSKIAISSFLGGMACVFVNLCWLFFMKVIPKSASTISFLRYFYGIEVVKLLFTALLFICIFVNYTSLNGISLFITFMAGQAVSVFFLKESYYNK